MAEGEQTAGDPGAPQPPKLRRRLFGYRREDVDGALAARAAELEELRQDIAALWLAFAQHDRMIRSALAPSQGGGGTEPASTVAGGSTPAAGGLSELDDALAAIETATAALERTYAEEITQAGPEQAPAEPQPEPPEPDEADGTESASPSDARSSSDAGA